MLTKQIEAMLQEAVQSELYASHLYKHLANQLQRLGYFGAQKHFAAEYADEVEHYQKLANLLNDMGSVAKLPMIEAITDPVTTLRDAFEIAFETETQLGSDYERWFKGCADAPLVQQALHFFLEKQRTSSGEYRDWITRLDRAGTNEAALLLIDQELGEG